MPTQIEPTPVLYGKDAKDVLEQVQKTPSAEQRKKARQRREFFNSIKKKGLAVVNGRL